LPFIPSSILDSGIFAHQYNIDIVANITKKPTKPRNKKLTHIEPLFSFQFELSPRLKT
jgi:hypothetical protein